MTVQPGLHPDFLRTVDPPTNPDVPIFYISPKNFVPSLLPGEVERIDNLLLQAPEFWARCNPPPPEQKNLVIGDRRNKPELNEFSFANEKGKVTCSHCGKTAMHKNMLTCSRYVSQYPGSQ